MYYIALIVMFFFSTISGMAQPAPHTITLDPEIDKDSLIRNPASGWILYDDANLAVANAADYWKAQDEAARQHASIFYVRWRWSNYEPTEGHYAWKEDANFKALIQGALDRGLRLSGSIPMAGTIRSRVRRNTSLTPARRALPTPALKAENF